MRDAVYAFEGMTDDFYSRIPAHENCQWTRRDTMVKKELPHLPERVTANEYVCEYVPDSGISAKTRNAYYAAMIGIISLVTYSIMSITW